ncbi:hypothetical protein Tco_0247974 [Tanacetum coccineum]
MSLDKLPTRLSLSLRGIEIPSIIYPICSSVGESGSHLFFGCNMARLLLRKVTRWWELEYPDLNSYEEWLAWFNSIRLHKGLKDVLEGVFYVMWWAIWKFRNQVLFGSSQPRLALLFDEISSNTKIFTPFDNPERQFWTRKNTTPLSVHNIYSFYESESSESEFEETGITDIETLALEQYLALERGTTNRKE